MDILHKKSYAFSYFLVRFVWTWPPTVGGKPAPTAACSALDPLTLSLCLDAERAGRDVADDPMMVELVASLSIIKTAGTPPPVLAAPVEDEAPEMPSPGRSCGSLGLDAGWSG